ncbi:unnamed protein product [Effrenium voratum]|uniref:Transmembrane protein n=2 Tax=Effrenium voratum TaxID=2562239 RepID=A0AA36ICC7_9DINO|nr:unnamed protein product [Effrenium voratum]
MSRRAGSVVVLGALACLVWGPSFTGSVPRRQESALARMASSKWVNPEDPEMSHPSGLYVLPLKPAKPQENYIYTWKKGEDGSIEDYVKTPFKGPERAADYYTQRKDNGAWDHWGPQGEGEPLAAVSRLEKKMSRRAGSVVVLGALACLVWGPSFTGSVPRRQESALARMASSKWVNPEDPEMSHPSGLYVLPLKPAKPQENYIYTWKKGEDGSIEDYVKTPFKGPERAADYYTQRKDNGAWDHWGPQGEGEA